MKHLAYCPYTLKFRFDAGTSRGVMKTKKTFFIKVWDDSEPDIAGYGEVAWFRGLSPESEENVLSQLEEAGRLLSADLQPKMGMLGSAVTYGLEQALADLRQGGKGVYFSSPFLEGKREILINGLIWMGDHDTMLSRLRQKIEEGFRCIKIKIGAIRWEEEISLLKYIRDNFGSSLTIRVDANGGLSPTGYMRQLDELKKYEVHSIEQPLPAGDWERMKEICRESPVPVALDEELIGVEPGNFDSLVSEIKPAYIVLKPALCGGFYATKAWIELADKYGIGWWITSSLESSMGLDALAQFVGALNVGNKVQGLGTGNLYHNNLPSPLRLEGERLRFIGPSDVFRSELQQLEWEEIRM